MSSNEVKEHPKVTIEMVEAAIREETYTVLPDGRTTICQLTLDNGFTVDGHSACVVKENYNQELGEKYSREKAIDKVWNHLGFRLADQLSGVSIPNSEGDFGWALRQLHDGKKLYREKWAGADLFVYLVPEASYKAQTGVAKEFFGEDAMVPYGAYLAIKTSDNTVNTWVPSISDVLAKDWNVTI